MRMDKLTLRFQQALADAQSLAVGRDHQFIEPAHVLAALLDQQGGSMRPLLDKAGVNVNRAALAARRGARPPAEGRGHAPATCTSRNDLEPPAQRHRQARAAARRPVHLQRAVRARGARRQRRRSARSCARPARVKGAIEKAIEELRGGEKVDDPNAEEQRQALEKYTIDLTARAEQGKLDPVIGRDDEIRRTDPGAAAPHQEQSRADRRARRRQDRDRRRPRAAHRQRRSARRPARASASSRSTWAR